MNLKKRVNGSWTDTPYYIHNTSADTITTLPAVIHPTGTTATVGLKGNTVQSGTPTPDTPVDVAGCGEKTANLFDKSQAVLGKEIDGLTYKNNSQYLITGFIPVEGGKTYYKSVTEGSILLYYNADYEETVVRKLYVSDTGYFTIPSGYNYIVLNTLIKNIDEIMINAGSAPLPYEPYGYKIPILSANTTTPVYLGEVETTRKIRKLVLTGEEIYIKDSGGEYLYYIHKSIHMNQTYCFCSHLVHTKNYPVYEVGCFTYGNPSVIYLNFGGDVMDEQPSGNTVAGIKEYIAAQYAAGTPVTIWYVLETEETGIVNEPLMKIGDYADGVSNVSIPVTTGGDTLSVGSTVQPSEVTVNYKGWHPAAVHERTNGAWT